MLVDVTKLDAYSAADIHWLSFWLVPLCYIYRAPHLSIYLLLGDTVAAVNQK